ncbi:MAG: phosphatase PAP2 family protein [Hyphomicrobiales bacterium]|nr:phosphatase PAP2 family protein [Hyphomicrobiales bacterium]
MNDVESRSDRKTSQAGQSAAPAPSGSLMRRTYDAIMQAGRDFVAQWRGRPLARFEYDAGRLLLIAGFWIVIIGIVAVLFDAQAARAARTLGPGWQQFFVFVTDFGKSGYLFLWTGLTCIAAVAASALGGERVNSTALSVLGGRAAFLFAVLAGSGVASLILKRIGRARPKLLDDGGAFQFNPLIIKSSWASFPSGHSITAFAFAMALSYFLPRWRLPLLAAALLVGVSRVIVGAHYPSDVVAGACIGIVSAVLLRRMFAARSIVFKPAGDSIVARGQGLIVPALRRLIGI